MNLLSLFSGIGAIDLGLERAGMTVVGQVELDEFCRSVLDRHWPGVPKHADVRTCIEWWRSEPRPPVHLVAGGFQCQPFSSAGRRRGVADERWGWPWMADVIRAVRPRYVLVENVADLVRDAEAWGWLLGDLSVLGFDAEWSVVSACSLGAPHTRERVFLVAYPNSGDGQAGMGIGPLRPWSLPGLDHRSRAWRDHVDRSLEASRADDRETDGLARRMVTAGGNAAVVDVAEHVGRLILAADRQAVS